MRLNKWFLFAGLLLSGVCLNYHNYGYCQNVLFDEGWRFHSGNAADPTKDFNYGIANIYSKSGNAENSAINTKFDDKDWRTVQLPHDWAVELPFVYSSNADVESHGYKPIGGLYPETSIGWYRKHFNVTNADKGKRISIRFDGVFRDAKFWINGFYLGTNESGYMGVSYDLTDFINFDKENVIVVRVDASQYEGWFYEGAGIYRHVWLNKCNNLHISEHGVFVYSEVRDKSAYVTIETSVETKEAKASSCIIHSYVTNRDGKIIGTSADQQMAVKDHGKESCLQQVKVENPRLWSLNDPYLYRAVVILKMGGQVTDSVIIRFGVRTISFDSEKGLFLNGDNVKVHGVCCHQDHAGIGTALPDDMQYYRLGLLKELGANAYRTCHNPPTPELLDACDSLGILVLDENRLLNSGPEYLSQFEKMILRDRNHPSIFLWSIGNEEGYIQTNEIGKQIATTLLALQKQLDPTRISTYAADVANVYTGINEVIPVRGFNYRQSAVADYHKSHPTQPIIGTEMGSTVTTRGIYVKDTIKGYVPDQDIIAPWWASKAEEWWTLCAAQPWWMGGFVWTGFDYRGEPTPYEWPDINSNFGLMDMCGFPKNIYYYYQSWWTDKDVLHISPHWNWHGKEGSPIQVWVNSNADNVELFLNGNSYGKKEMKRNSHLEWEIPYKPGILKAVAYKNGRKLTNQVETTGEAVKLKLTPDKKVIHSNEQDVIVINVTALDNKNREVPDAGNLIRLNLKGNATIIGVGNGDPSSHEADKCMGQIWQRKLFNGKCQIIIRTGKAPGIVELEAQSDGLMNDKVVFETLP
jgi:beta-galactosidase